MHKRILDLFIIDSQNILAIMKRHITYMFFAAIALGMISSTIPDGFADDAAVSIPSGTSVPGCEETDECYLPYTVTISPGDKVTWSNDDTAAHTVTSGTPVETDGKFDSGLFSPNTTFSHTFENAGNYDYFCMVHPWMKGVVTVQKEGGENSDNKTVPGAIVGAGEDIVGGAEDIGKSIVEGTEDVLSDIGQEAEDLIDPITDDMIKMQSMTVDGEIMVNVYTSEPTTDEKLSIVTEFLDRNDEPIQDIVYDIKAMQDGKRIFSEEAVQTDRYGQHTTESLATDNPVDIDVKIISVDGVDASLGPKGEVISFHVVPEFGTIAMMILAVAIISIIAITAKTNRLAIMPKL
ncbi:cupredoxin domain-containing protein [Nitrosopumilus sp.]|uniref:cupredoxin domain-containing protein n=1 Tax=Nitrosopumilus sp. TaxID=2024843 RepID=UPI003B5BB20F